MLRNALIITGALLLLIQTGDSKEVQPLDIPVIDYRNTEYRYMFELKSKASLGRVILDCQSFLNGINLYKKNHPHYPKPAYNFFLYSNECQKIHQFLISQMERNENACVRIYKEEKRFELFSNKECQRD